MIRLRNPFYFFCLTCLSLSAETLKIPSSSGGIIDKEIEQQYEKQEVTPEKEVPSVQIDIPEEELDIPEGKKILLNTIKVRGNTLIPDKEIRKVVEPYEGTEMSMRTIREVCRKIQNTYIEKGYFLVRVYPPAQEISDRTLCLEIMEAKLGKLEVQGNRVYSTKFIRSYFLSYLGASINYNDFVKTMLLLNENNDLAAGAVFQKGSEFGTVDLLVRVQDADPYHISADFNNYGSKVTARCRSGIRNDVGNVLQEGDRLSLIGVTGYPLRQLGFLDAIYDAPINRKGLRFEGSFLYSDFRVDESENSPLSGRTQIAGCKITQALQRTKKLNTDIYAGFEYKQIRNFAEHNTTAFDKLRELSLGCTVDYMDSCAGHNVADLSIFCGIPNFLGGLPAVGGGCSREDAGGRFVYIDGNYQRVQRLPWSGFFVLSFQGQLSFYKLPVSEEFYIGGINTLRGYPLAVALGDSGFCVNGELRLPPPLGNRRVPFGKKLWKEVLQFTTFVDHGEVFVYGGGIAKQVNRLFLTSAGVGAKVFAPYGIDCSMDLGFPLVNRKQKTQNAIFYFRINMRFL